MKEKMNINYIYMKGKMNIDKLYLMKGKMNIDKLYLYEGEDQHR